MNSLHIIHRISFKDAVIHKLNIALLAVCCLMFLSVLPAFASPAPPSGLTAIAGNSEATLSWSASPGATWYLLYRSSTPGGPYAFVAQTPSFGITDHGLANGSSYYYVVTALDASGQSANSGEAAVTTSEAVLPAPTGVTAVPGNTQTTLTWNPVTSAVGYNVYRSTTSGGPYTLLTPPAPGPSFTDTGLVNGTEYYYVVQALSTNSGAYSDEVRATPSALVPAAPANLLAEPGSSWVRLSWSAAADASGYAVYRSTTTGGPYDYIGFTPTTGYEDFSRANGNSYYYVVAAVNAKGRGAFSTEQSAAVDDLKMPHAVALTAKLAGNGQINLTWSNSAGAISYIVRRATASGGPYDNLGVRSTGYTDGGLANGVTYYYVVDALNAGETVVRSNEVALAPVAGGIPSTPGGIAVFPGNTQATVTWNPVPGATGYNLSVATFPGGPNIGAGIYYSGTGATVVGLTNGVPYYFKIQAAANGWSAYSGEVSTTPLEALPVAPLEPALTGGNSQLSLTWKPSAGATEYHVYRRTEGNPWPGSPTGIVTGTLFNDSGLTNGTAYQYVVAAVNASGSSAWSSSQTATPVSNGISPAPLNLAVIPGSTQVTLTWDPVPGASGYNVIIASSAGGPLISSYLYFSGPSATVTGLTNTETYYFRVQAATIGWSAYSSEVSTTLPTNLPLAPVELAITGGNSQLSLTWKAVTSATSYQIYRRTEGNPWPLAPVGTANGTLYTDSGLVNGVNYQYAVAAVKAAGAGAWSSSQSRTPSAVAVTLAPTIVAVIPGNTQATITWDPVPGANGYSVTVATTPGGINISPYGYMAGPSYTVTGLTNGQTYYFRVQASGSTWSAYSAEVSAAPTVAKLLAPTGLTVASGDTQLTLNWSSVVGATSYAVYRRIAGNAWPATPVGTPATNSFTDTGLVNGTAYYYVVSSGNGPWSSEAFAIPADTVQPDTTITANPPNPSTSITADFSFSSNKPGSTFQCQLDTSPYVSCSSPATYTGLAAGSHSFNVRAIDSVGNMDPSPANYTWTVNTDITVPTGSVTINNGATVTDTVSVTLTLSCSDPDGCTQIQLSNDGSSWSPAEALEVTKSWNLASGDGTKTVYVKFKDSAGYWSNIYTDTIILNTAPKALIINRAGTGKGTVTSEPAGIACGAVCQAAFDTGTSVALSAVADGGSVFVAWSGDCSGSSPSTSVQLNQLRMCTARFDNTAPTPLRPLNLSTVIGNGEATISWSASSGASWYLLYRSSTPGGPYTFVSQTTALGITDHGLGNSSSYYYVVTALNASGQSAYSDEVSVVPTAIVLPAPHGVAAIPGNGQATLTWDVVTSEVVYNVYRSTTSGGPYTLLTPPAPGASFTDTGLVNGTEYYYVIQTLSTNSGAYSDEVRVTPTDLVPTAPTNLLAEPGNTWARLSWDAVADASGYVVYRATTTGGPYEYAGFTPTPGYEDFSRVNGLTYYYVVAAVNATGRGAFSTEQSAAVDELGMPHAVALTAKLAGDRQINLAWPNAAGAVSYIVRRATVSGGPYTSLGVQSSSYIDTDLTNGVTYYYVVDALNAGETVPRSNEVALAPVAGGIPSAPGGIAVYPGNTQATVTWNPVPGATGYDLSVATSPGGPNLGAGIYYSGSSATVVGLTNEITYYFRVRASANGWSGYSSEVSTAPSKTLPVAPLELAITGGNSQLSLTWKPSAGATSYQVYRRADGNPWPVDPVGTTTGTLFNDSGLTNGTAYQYLVAAINASGSSAWSSSQTATPAASGLSLAPANLAIIPGNTQATITWDPVPGATGYSVTVATSAGGPNIGSYMYYSGPSATITGLTNTKTYYFRVQAAANAWSAYSSEVSAPLSTDLPLAPVELAITGGNSQLSLTWKAASGATSYQIYRRTEGTPWPAAPVGTSSGTLYTDSGLTNAIAYQYAVAAVKAAGAGAWSSSQSRTPSAVALTLAPLNVAVTPGNTQATLSWDPVPGANGYNVTVATTPGGANFGPYGYFAGPSSTVTGLTNGQTYYFRVQANANSSSAYSAEVSATPSASRPMAPTDLGIHAGINSQLEITWSPLADATGYNIYRRTTDSGYELAGSALVSAFTDTGLTNGTRYYYVVESTSLAGPGARSGEQSGVPADTTAPTGTISINAGATHTTNTLVSLTLTCTDDSACSEMQFSNDGWNWSEAEPIAVTKEWNIPGGMAVNTVSVRFKDTAGNWSNSFADSITFQHTLTVQISGSGTVNNGSGFTCGSSSCPGVFDYGTFIELFATASDQRAIFSEWVGDCSGNGSCQVMLDRDRSVTAMFVVQKPYKVGGTLYDELQTAYNDAAAGEIYALIGTAPGAAVALSANIAKTVTLIGGYPADYSSSGGYTIIPGRVNVNAGKLVIRDIKVR